MEISSIIAWGISRYKSAIPSRNFPPNDIKIRTSSLIIVQYLTYLSVTLTANYRINFQPCLTHFTIGSVEHFVSRYVPGGE
jgi:hypothetical protein